MRINLHWLQELVDCANPQTLADALCQAGAAVEEVDEGACGLGDVVVVEVEEVTAHPRADRLRQVVAFDGQARWQLVTAAANVAVGQRVAHARPGVRLPNGLTIATRSLRGVDSQGMLCGAAELGLPAQNGDGIWILPATATVGAGVLGPVGAAPVVVATITPNRPDLMSLVGVAREVGAAGGRRPRPLKARAPEKGPDVGTLARLVVEDVTGCRRYGARVVRNVVVGPSPPAVQARLVSVGLRPINNVVDATQVVLYELGVPVHAFDLARLGGLGGAPTVRVRRAQAGEGLHGLDGGHHRLHDGDLVVADAGRPVALAGIVGDQASAVGPGTSAVLLEAIAVDPARARTTARRLRVRTEASLRSEHGVDAQQVGRALDRLAQLVAEWAGGDVAKGVLEHLPKPEAREIPLRPARVERLLGQAIAPETLVALLEPLEIRCVGRTDQALVFQIPAHRPDVLREVDLIEEVARRHGLARLPARLPSAARPWTASPRGPTRRRQLARRALLSAGLSECIGMAFGNPSWYGGGDQGPLRLVNPLGAATSTLRTSLVPGLLAAAAHNLRHGRGDLRLFEIGTTFHRRRAGAPEDPRDQVLPQEVARIGICLVGRRSPDAWFGDRHRVDFSDLMGAVEALLEALRLAQPWTVRPAEVAGFHPLCAAELVIGDALIGVAGRLLPETCARSGLEATAFAAELSLSALAAQPGLRGRYAPAPKTPPVRRDVALVVPRSLPQEALRTALHVQAAASLGAQVVERVRLFDRWAGPPLAAEEVSLAFALDFRHPDRSLTDAEVNVAMEAVVAQITTTYGVRLRA